MRLPSGLNSRALTASACPRSSPSFCQPVVSHNAIRPSSPPVARILRSGESASARTAAEWVCGSARFWFGTPESRTSTSPSSRAKTSCPSSLPNEMALRGPLESPPMKFGLLSFSSGHTASGSAEFTTAICCSPNAMPVIELPARTAGALTFSPVLASSTWRSSFRTTRSWFGLKRPERLCGTPVSMRLSVRSVLSRRSITPASSRVTIVPSSSTVSARTV